MSNLFKPHPLGDPVNGSPHSVCVSLPRMADVIGYEEKDPQVLSSFAAGYPRFFQNPLITGLANRLEKEGCMQATDPLLPTEAVARDLCRFLGLNEHCVAPVESVWTVRLSEDPGLNADARVYLQHTGSGISSREAEGIMERWFDVQSHPEKRIHLPPEENLASVQSILHSIYGTASESDIHVYRSGMNAIYAGFRALQAIQAEQGRNIWIQLGWLYVDTTRVLDRFAMVDSEPVTVYNVVDLTDLKESLADLGHRVAGIVTEVPTNPLIQTPDIGELRELADKYKAALILDPSLVSPCNVDVFPQSDMVVTSLTKYAAQEADVMMGALALNPSSRFYDDLKDLVNQFGTVPYSGDLARIAVQIPHFRETVRNINASTCKVAEFLEGHPAVKDVYWAYTQPSAYNYNWLRHMESGPGGIISFTLNKPIEKFYDPSHLVKSPSFGARYSMMCPFMYLAHYDLVKSEHGRNELRRLGVDPDLIRLCVGLEPVEAIIEELNRTLSS